MMIRRQHIIRLFILICNGSANIATNGVKYTRVPRGVTIGNDASRRWGALASVCASPTFDRMSCATLRRLINHFEHIAVKMTLGWSPAFLVVIGQER